MDNKEENSFKKATIFTDPLGNTCVKYDLVDIELDEDNNKVIRTQLNETFQKRAIIEVETVKFLTYLSLITCIFFIPTGIPSVIFSQLMKKHYLNLNYEKAFKYKHLAKIFSYSNVIFGICTFVVIMLFIPLI